MRERHLVWALLVLGVGLVLGGCNDSDDDNDGVAAGTMLPSAFEMVYDGKTEASGAIEYNLAEDCFAIDVRIEEAGGEDLSPWAGGKAGVRLVYTNTLLPLRQIEYGADGAIDEASFWTWDGSAATYCCYEDGDETDGTLMDKVEYVYNGNLEPLTAVYYSGVGQSVKYSRETTGYDDHGNSISVDKALWEGTGEEAHWGEASPERAWENEYDEAGRLVSRKRFRGSAREFDRSWKYAYDGLRHIVNAYGVESGKENTWANDRTTKTYDDAGRLLDIVNERLNSDGSVSGTSVTTFVWTEQTLSAAQQKVLTPASINPIFMELVDD